METKNCISLSYSERIAICMDFHNLEVSLCGQGGQIDYPCGDKQERRNGNA
jgi:hypothetical protein